MKRIMVGVDASPASVEALQRAAEEARQREAALEVVYVFSPPEQTTAWPVPPEKGDDKATTVEEARAEAYERSASGSRRSTSTSAVSTCHGPRSLIAVRLGRWWSARRTPTWSWSALGVGTGSPASSSAQSANRSRDMPKLRC
jgi:hypothetical protein